VKMTVGTEENAAGLKQKTNERYSFLWNRHDAEKTPEEFHYDRMSRLLPTGHLAGRVLDAGCGQGIDSLRMAERGTCSVVSVDLSEGGAAITRQRTKHRTNVHVVRGDLERLPLAGEQFDFVYSYGVLHHTPHPEQGLSELVRVLKPGGLLAIYLYEDFADRSLAERALLKWVNTLRAITVAMPPRRLYRVCQAVSPIVYVCLTLPAKALKLIGLDSLSRRIPYHHGAHPFSMAADLYDRFAAPIEKRYSREMIGRWLSGHNLQGVNVSFMRGWVGYGRKPHAL
jgi:ubiquinone/menaquinone biosynthesis C-methylase UbiE